MKRKKTDWTFAKVIAEENIASLALRHSSIEDLYRKSLNDREGKRKMLQNALNAALENLMSWERVARAEGFEVKAITDIYNGAPHPEIEGDIVRFIQAYGVIVRESEEGTKV